MKKIFKAFAVVSAIALLSSGFIACSDDDDDGDSVPSVTLPPSVGTNELKGNTWKYINAGGFYEYKESYEFKDSQVVYQNSEKYIDGYEWSEGRTYNYSYNSTDKTISLALYSKKEGDQEWKKGDFEAYWKWEVENDEDYEGMTSQELAEEKAEEKEEFDSYFSEIKTYKYSLDENNLTLTEVLSVENFKYYEFNGDSIYVWPRTINIVGDDYEDFYLKGAIFNNGNFSTSKVFDDDYDEVSSNTSKGTYTVTKDGENIVLKLKFTQVPSEVASVITANTEYTLIAEPYYTWTGTKQ